MSSVRKIEARYKREVCHSLDPGRLQLNAWRLSGGLLVKLDSPGKQQIGLQPLKPCLQSLYMMESGKSSVLGVVDERQILSLPLFPLIAEFLTYLFCYIQLAQGRVGLLHVGHDLALTTLLISFREYPKMPMVLSQWDISLILMPPFKSLQRGACVFPHSSCLRGQKR